MLKKLIHSNYNILNKALQKRTSSINERIGIGTYICYVKVLQHFIDFEVETNKINNKPIIFKANGYNLFNIFKSIQLCGQINR